MVLRTGLARMRLVVSTYFLRSCVSSQGKARQGSQSHLFVAPLSFAPMAPILPAFHVFPTMRCRALTCVFVSAFSCARVCRHRARGGSRAGTEATFGVVHFAGEVIYDATEFVEKNRDEVPTALHDLVLSSNDRYLSFYVTCHKRKVCVFFIFCFTNNLPRF